MIIDFHLHVGQEGMWNPSMIEWSRRILGEGWQQVEDTMSSPQLMDEFLASRGVDRGVILAEASPAVTGIIGNDHVAGLALASKRLIGFCSVNPNTTPKAAAEVRRCAVELGMRGLKLYPTYQYLYPNDHMLYPIYETAQELGMVVMFHTGSSTFPGSRLKYGDPVYLDDVAVDFPSLKIVLAHGGRPLWYETAFLLARTHANVFIETSGIPVSGLLTAFPKLERIPHKFIFGSDWPEADPGRSIKQMRALPLSDETRRLLLGGNAAELLGLEGDTAR